jgi:tRNA nucleotidyltransferase (CCA-adding enzyme)
VLFEFSRDSRIPPSRVYDLLHPLDIEQVLLMMAKARKEGAKKYISLYLTRLRDTRISLSGEDLKGMGIPPGPRYKRILADLLDARLDGLVTTEEDERHFVQRTASR